MKGPMSNTPTKADGYEAHTNRQQGGRYVYYTGLPLENQGGVFGEQI